jgi:hypothetical protein
LVIVPRYSKGGVNGEVNNSQMSSKTKVVLSAAIAGIIAVALIGAAIFIPGAGIFGPSSSSAATLGIQLTDPPTVPPGVTDVYISYSEMAVHVADAGNNSGWYKIAPAGEIDLMSVVSTSITLGSAKVSSGVYNAVGFNITSATVTVNGQNESAFISSNKMIVPLVGGVQVNSGASVGVLIDLSPTVIAVQNGGQTAYVLIPSAHGLHIPDSAWRASDHAGDEVKDIQQQTWYQDEVHGQIALSKVQLSADSLNVTVTNTGTTSTAVSSLSVYYPLSVICQQYTGSCSATTSGDDAHGVPVALFGVLSNGTLIQYNFTASAIAHYTNENGGSSTITESSSSTSSSGDSGVSSTTSTTSMTSESQQPESPLELAEQQGVHLGYVLAPGQSVTFTFSGKIATISPVILNYIQLNVAVPTNLINAMSTINSGQLYLVTASGPFDTFAYQQITAS